MNDDKQILPCPFCGSDPIGPVFNRGKYAMYCPCCEYFGPVGANDILAKEAWNTRHKESDG